MQGSDQGYQGGDKLFGYSGLNRDKFSFSILICKQPLRRHRASDFDVGCRNNLN